MKSSIVLLISFLFLNGIPVVYAQGSYLSEGVRQYKQENYEEAIELLKKARAKNPESSSTAFMLGMAYKQTLQYDKALPHFKDAVRLKPRIKDAVLELANIYLQAGKTDEAGKWITLAEKQGIFPAKTAFLKGLMYQKTDKNAEAVISFEKARQLDSSLAQACDYNIALCRIKERKPASARKSLEAAIQHDPESDLATFARRYADILDKQAELQKPLRLIFAVLGQYDTNVVLEPSDGATTDISNEASPVLTTNIRVDYLPMLEGPWLFTAQYAFASRLHKYHSTSYDSISNTLYAAPGYNFGEFALNLATRFTHTLLRDPSYKNYMSNFSTGPMIRTTVGDSHLLELFTGYKLREYAKAALTDEEERDSDSFNAYLSWMWFYKKNAFVNIRYYYSNEDADGANWCNQNNRFSLNTSYPVWKTLRFQITGEAGLKNFKNTHTTFNKKREDRLYILSTGLTWEFLPETSLILQYNYTRADSNISIYDYDRNVYSAGVEFRF